MNVFRILKVAILLVLGLSLVSASKSWAEDERSKAVFVVIENGGLIEDRLAHAQAISSLLGELVQLRRRRATRETQIHIILSANPTEVAWAGTPQQLFDDGHSVLELVKLVNTCSDLVRAWAQVDTTRRITIPDEFTLIGIGPLIHAGFPCDQGDRISVPQAAPSGLRLGPLALEADRLRLLMVHPDQDEVYLGYLERNGVLERAKNKQLDFDMMDAARTRAASGTILKRKK